MRQIAQHASESTELAIRNTEFLFGAIAAAGFPISWGKSIILPTCQFPIVGHDIDTEGSIRLALSCKRWAKLQGLLEQALSVPLVTPRLLASIGGGIQSGSLVLDHVLLFLRGLYQLTSLALALSHGWDFGFTLPEDALARTELIRFRHLFNLPRIWKTLCFDLPIQLAIDLEGFTDAGGWALGAVLRPPTITMAIYHAAIEDYHAGILQLDHHPAFQPQPGELHTATNLDPSQFDESSTLRKLRAIALFLTTHADRIKNKTIRLFVDNLATTFIVNYGSNTPEGHQLLCSLLSCVTCTASSSS
jgi:hypothetical protein